MASRLNTVESISCRSHSTQNMPSDPGIAEESSESEAEVEEARSYHRKISTSKQIQVSVCIKDGYLMKQTSSFQRWRKRYFKLKGRKLYYANDTKSVVFDEVDLTDLSVAECSTKNANNSFTVITPFRSLILCADSRKEMEDWIAALRSAGNREFYDPNMEHPDFSGQHNWYACSHARPTYCNVCREALSGVTSHGLSCEVCKLKTHKRCAVKAVTTCKWTTLASIGKEIIEDDDGQITMSHQWVEGNLPVSAKCVVCDKTCGSVLRLQDWRCLWCKALVHTSCRSAIPVGCPLGLCKVSVMPPTSLTSIETDLEDEVTPPVGCSPLLVFVNSKSGDNQGVKFLHRFRQNLNPAQVYDLMNGGPSFGLRLFRRFHSFRLLVCGGDGSIGWVFNEIDKLRLINKCRIAVLPLGTGNDLARVLGWGGLVDDDTHLSQLIERYEMARTKMLDRWSLMTYEGPLVDPKANLAFRNELCEPIAAYEDSVAAHLSKILHSDQHSVVISSAKILCETIKDFVAKVDASCEHEEPIDDCKDEKDDSISRKCSVLNEKLNSLLNTLSEESKASQETRSASTSVAVQETMATKQDAPTKHHVFKPRDALMSRANSLKKAVRQIIEHTERAVDEQNEQTSKNRVLSALSEEHATTSYRVTAETIHEYEETDNKHSSTSAVPNIAVHGPTYAGYHAECVSDEEEEEEDTLRGLEPLRFRNLTDVFTLGFTRPPPPVEKSPNASRRISSGSTFSKAMRSTSPKDIPPGSLENIPLFNPTFPAMSLFPKLPRVHSPASSVVGGLVSKVLLANADALCAAAVPMMDSTDDALDGYQEKSVMNNYFGIGLDAKITLDFHNRREEHPEKCRSRTKNLMWYGMLGTKELLQRSYKNLEQRVHLECDGTAIPLPSLQGIVVLNIPSYMGGIHFWGGDKEDDNFTAPACDDRILEVMAVFGSAHMGAARVMALQHHRIAQCRSVKITLTGDEGLPVQVDGEAWVQPPGSIHIMHKNRAQVLARNKEFEMSLREWKDKHVVPRPKEVVPTITEEEVTLSAEFVEVATMLIRSVKVACISSSHVERYLLHSATEAANNVSKLFPGGRLAEGIASYGPCGQQYEMFQLPVRKQLYELVQSVRRLQEASIHFLTEKVGELELRPQLVESISAALDRIEVELKKVVETDCLAYFHEEEHVDIKKKKHGGGIFKLKFGRHRSKEKLSGSSVANWDTSAVASWLDTLGLGDYREAFIGNDVCGPELLTLQRRDLKDLGVHKVGHIKRIQQAIKDLSMKTVLPDKTSSASM
ncbi:PREDICTED: diacylglycerol kinase delta-like [Priapulus caudatus]|uniref:Diacylglycerol kinase n=1 Tax=Priapulus caudatus TaxID=37621 RepID=A0ABM1DZB1_PRICU|nr:PREDICTED: diacylglycerol kinase delta-like [Priapulus caudatus]